MRSNKTAASAAPITPFVAFRELCVNLFRYFAFVGFVYVYGKYGNFPNAHLFEYGVIALLITGCVYAAYEFAAFRKKTSPPAPEVTEAPSA